MKYLTLQINSFKNAIQNNDSYNMVFERVGQNARPSTPR